VKVTWICSLLALVCLCACSPASNEQKAVSGSDTNEVAILKTSEGEMVLEFWPDVAPLTVENFKKLARANFYDVTCIHRVIPGFIIQGGDPLSKDSSKMDQYGKGGPSWKVKGEFSDRKHERGVISMARSPKDPDSAGSQFFICLGDANTPRLQNLNGKYTAFGRVIKGDDVLEKISKVKCTGPNSMGEMAVPEQRVEVFSVQIAPRNSLK
jgi:peptidyl-prolyl cis-trans isomerase B (cyclophilin B)